MTSDDLKRKIPKCVWREVNRDGMPAAADLASVEKVRIHRWVSHERTGYRAAWRGEKWLLKMAIDAGDAARFTLTLRRLGATTDEHRTITLTGETERDVVTMCNSLGDGIAFHGFEKFCMELQSVMLKAGATYTRTGGKAS